MRANPKERKEGNTKLTNGEIFNAREPLAKLMEQKFPVKVSFGLAKMANKLQDSFKAIEGVRLGLIKTYGEIDPENPQNIFVKPKSKNFSKFVEEMNELLSQEVEVVFEKVKLPEKVASTCDSCHHNMDRMLEIEPNILTALEKFIEVE